MSSVALYNQGGQSVGQVTLDPKVFDLKPNPGLIEQAVVTLLANRRHPIAHTKTKGEVRGGGRKPWKQKGTGRARHGSIRSPQWKGGGVVFGPRSNRNFTIKMNAVSRRQALLMTLSDKAQHERLVVLDAFTMTAPKTKEVVGLLKKLPQKKTSLFVLPTSDQELVRAGRNIPGLDFIRADSLNVYDIVGHQQLIVLQSALPVISKTYAQ